MVLVLVVSSLDLRTFLHIYCLWRFTRPFLGPAHQGLTLVVFWGCPSCFGPRLSGLNPVGGFFSLFSFFFIMPRRFPCTVSIDVREFADLGKTRPEVVSKIINSFHPIKPMLRFSFWAMMQRLLSRVRPISEKSWLMNLSLLRELSVLFGGRP